MNKDKIKNIVIVVLLLIIVIGTCVFISLQTSNQDIKKDNSVTEEKSDNDNQIQKQAEAESAAIKEDERKSLSEIGVSEYLEIYRGEENKIVFIGRPTCSFCTTATPILEHIAYLNQLDIQYLNTDNFTGDDQTNFVQSNEFFQSFGTPVLLIVSNEKIVASLAGLNTIENFTLFLQDHGFI